MQVRHRPVLRHGGVWIGLATAAGLAVCLLILPTSPSAVDTETVDLGSHERSRATLVGRGGALSPRSPGTTQEPAPDPLPTKLEIRSIGEAPESCSVRGFVSRCTSMESGRSPPESVSAPLKNGTCSLEIPDEWFAHSDGVSVQAGIAGYCIKKRVTQLEIARHSHNSVEIAIDAGLSLAGRVVTTENELLEGVTVVARRLRGGGAIKTQGSYAVNDWIYSGDAYYEGRCVTGADGSFVIHGLSDRPYLLTTSDLDWGFVPVPRPALNPPRIDVRVVAERTRRLRLRILDAVSRNPVPSARVVLVYRSLRGDMHAGLRCEGGEADIALLPRTAGEGGTPNCDIEVRVQAVGYRPLRDGISLASGSRRGEAELQLVPVAVGEVRFKVDGQGVESATSRLRAVFSREGERHILPLVFDASTGAYACRLSCGEWTCSVFPVGALPYSELAWKGQVAIGEREFTERNIMLPAFGTVEVLGWDEVHSVSLRIETAGHRIHTVASPGNHTYHLRPGTWPYEAKLHDGRTEAGCVEVSAGKRVTVRIGRR